MEEELKELEVSITHTEEELAGLLPEYRKRKGREEELAARWVQAAPPPPPTHTHTHTQKSRQCPIVWGSWSFLSGKQI